MEKIYEHFKGDEAFAAKLLEDKARVLESYVPMRTAFLNPHEQEVATKVIGTHQGVKIAFYGGMEGAELKRALIYHEMDEITQDDFQIVLLKITYNKTFTTITHQDLLGALMHLGIKREAYGDFVFEDGIAFFACDKALAQYIQMHLTRVKKSKVHCTIETKPITRQQQFQTKHVSIPSYRLDVLIGEAYHLSRKEARDLILSKKVKVNYKEVVQCDFLCHNNYIVSVRHYGRFKLNDLQRINKKGKMIIELMYYK